MDKQTENKEIKELLYSSFLEPYLMNDDITDISYNGTTLFIQDNKKGRYKAKDQPSQEAIATIVRSIANIRNKEFTDASPILDTEIDNIRLNAIHKTISPFGITMAIRVSKPRKAITSLATLANSQIEQLLKVLVETKNHMIISGETGSGKTELQKLLVDFIPEHHNITLMEDTMDSHIKSLYPNKDIRSWRIRKEENINVTFHDLIKSGLRNNPDWLIISEIRGGEAYEMLESALTNHSIITTLHASDAKSIPSRIMRMIGKVYQQNELLLGKDISQLGFGIHMGMDYTKEGSIRRYIKEIVEFLDFSEDGIEYNLIYERIKKYDEETKKYHEEEFMGRISEKTKKNLIFAEKIHQVPSIFM